ncbi:MAG: hypothetical protein A3J55_00735 [Candidatus Ryanbacteria bacterium RIFCSPHIGHO2_02_FULL_45_17b]|uniref:Peptidase A2 domain-containing protein n=1 Tax=Candidatus Ryanbacteria bacterium RIFCSPHIGHO2_01_FULL_45_22 TaxID=1802114 RepID=A0A1G2G0U9_9BACT|nr:MAG: hypothetical protein A2719_03200 [Candidatus Ryanbacteria bacterium RIFCSPHIGHO2_01_FULL_45_22]OGZ47069.1 MAG: hypothetical protein A3J55_00735 [Candidatus Ryanbacteria bacterium RIFCSPHIGHO2_02_FULL_45_17b]
MEVSGQIAIFPAARVVLHTAQKEELPVMMLIDSGATISALPKNIAPLLGIDLTKGKLLRIFGIDGKSIRAWRHEIPVKMGSYAFRLPVAFLNSENAPRVLGREGIFDTHTVIFEEAMRQSALLGSNTPHARDVQKTIFTVSSDE